MAISNFNGSLRSNLVYSAIFNMIISQRVFGDNIKGTNARYMEEAREDLGLYGDTALYYSVDVLKSRDWLNDAEAPKLLELERPQAPKCQAITIDTFRIIKLSLDNYLTKQAWSTEGAFSQFNSVMESMLSETKRIYDSTLWNTYVSTHETDIGKQKVTITLPKAPAASATEQEVEAYNRVSAQTIAKKLADIFDELEDPSRDYNDYGYMRSYDASDFRVIFNSDWLNKITKLDLPNIFNNNIYDGLLTDKLPAKYFGTINTKAGTTPETNTTIRSLIETDYGSVHVFPGELLPGSTAYEANTTYTEDGTIACKIYKKGAVPYMSAFSVATSFFNPQSLTDTRMLIFGHNSLQHLHNMPFITVRAKNAT